jgi:hypothetical protein
MSRIFRLILVAALLYIGSYIVFRQIRTEIWERDKQAYVIYPEGYGRSLYYLWRPLSYLDAITTGMRHHIGPHR